MIGGEKKRIARKVVLGRKRVRARGEREREKRGRGREKGGKEGESWVGKEGRESVEKVWVFGEEESWGVALGQIGG